LTYARNSERIGNAPNSDQLNATEQEHSTNGQTGKEVQMKKWILPLLLAALFVLHAIPAEAQYNVPHGVFSSGGGVRSGSNIIYDTAAQTAVTVSSGGSYIVKSGFWFVADISSTVDVTITSFDGVLDEFAVVLKWQSRADTPFEGFNVYRSNQGEEVFIRINPALIPPGGENEYRDEDVVPGKAYDYRIGAVEKEIETFSYTLTVTLPPKPLTLLQNYPNPFNPSTIISFYLPGPEHVSLDIFDIQGRKVRTLVDADKGIGTYDVIWNGINDAGNTVASGVYYYRLVAGKKAITKKLILLR
jgi:hypothetical protein